MPIVVLTEATTGYGPDARIRQFLNRLDEPRRPGAFFIPTTPPIGFRSGALRADALRSLAGTKHDISAIDAQVVAIAEELSFTRAVTILTSDPLDLRMLVDLTRRTNIAVDRV